MKKNRTLARLFVALLAVVMAVSSMSVTAFAASGTNKQEKETIKVRFFYYLDNYVEEDLEVPKGATAVTLKTLKDAAEEAGYKYSGTKWFIRDEYTKEIKTDSDGKKFVSARIEFKDSSLVRFGVLYFSINGTDGEPMVIDYVPVRVQDYTKGVQKSDAIYSFGSDATVGSLMESRGWTTATDTTPWNTDGNFANWTIIVPEMDTVEVTLRVENGSYGYFKEDSSTEKVVVLKKNGNSWESGGYVTFPTVQARPGYAFTGWRVVENGETIPTNQPNVSVIAHAEAYYTNKGYVTLVATFNACPMNITFNPNGGTLEGAKTATVAPGEKLSAPAIKAPNGKELIGWRVNVNGAFTDTILQDPISYQSLWDLGKGFNLELWAKWSETPIAVTFEIGEGYKLKSGSTAFDLKPKETKDLPKVEAEKGYTFTGWYTSDGIQVRLAGDTAIDYALAQKWGKDGTLVLKTKAEKSDIKVTFRADNATLENAEPVVLSEKSNPKATLPTVKPKDGYVLSSWQKNGGSAPLTEFTYAAVKELAGDAKEIELVAVCETGVTVKYVVDAEKATVTGGEDVVLFAAGNKAVDLPKVTPKAGYTFEGWYTSDGKTKVKGADDKEIGYIGASPSAKDGVVTLEAKLEANVINIYVKDDKDIKIVSKAAVTVDDFPYTLEAEAEEVTGKTFTGWLCNQDKQVYQTGAKLSYEQAAAMAEADGTAKKIVFVPQYGANAITVTFDAGNGGALANPAEATLVLQEGDKHAMPEIQAKAGYTFKEWKTGNISTTYPYIVYSWAAQYSSDGKTLKMTALYEAQEVRVAYKTADGQGTVKVIENLKDTDFPITLHEASAAADGKVFAGWEAEVGGKVYPAGSQLTYAEAMTLMGSNDTVRFKEKFEEKALVVTLDVGEGTLNGAATIALTPSTDQGEKPNIPTVTAPTGKSFIGWFLSGNTTDTPDKTDGQPIGYEWANGKATDGALTLTAKYSEAQAQVAMVTLMAYGESLNPCELPEGETLQLPDLGADAATFAMVEDEADAEKENGSKQDETAPGAFLGWAFEADAEEIFLPANAEVSYDDVKDHMDATGNVTLYAIFAPEAETEEEVAPAAAKAPQKAPRRNAAQPAAKDEAKPEENKTQSSSGYTTTNPALVPSWAKGLLGGKK